MTKDATKQFEIATWYDTWNQTGLDNLTSKKVPLQFATRYNLAFGELSADASGGYTINMTGQYADAVKTQILSQASDAVVYAGLGDTGIASAVADNKQHNNRSTRNIITWLQSNRYSGISIDAEGDGMSSVAELVTQLGADFRAAGLGIAVSVPWPAQGPVNLYGPNAVDAFNSNVNALELQDYSSANTSGDAQVWIDAGIKLNLLMGGVCTENSQVQTSLLDTQKWTEYALNNGLRGMFSWRLDNDHCTHGTQEDHDPTFTGAKTIYETVQNAIGKQMNVQIDFTDDGLVIRNTGLEPMTIPLGPANTFLFSTGTTIDPPEGKYWHVNMNTAEGGVTLGGTHGPVHMPANSSVSFYVDNLA